MRYTWHRVAEKGALPESFFNHSLVVLGNAPTKAYAVGVPEGGQSNALEIYELDSKLEQWCKLPASYENEPARLAATAPRHGHVVVGVGGAIYVIGGNADYDVVQFDATKRQWRVLSCPGRSRSCYSSQTAAVVEGKIVLVAGYVADEVNSDVHILDTVKGHWILPRVLGELSLTTASSDVCAAPLGHERLLVYQGSCDKDAWFLELDTPYTQQHKEGPVVAWSKYKPGTVPVVICGPSGVGKGTLIANLMQEFPDKFVFSVSHTTRKPREKETDGQHYHFTNHEAMERDIKLGKFLEYAKVHGNLYGTSIAAVQDVTDSGKCCILDIDVQGAQSVRKSSMPALFVFIAPPSFEELERRLRGRGTETEEQIMKRLETAKKELDLGRNSPLFDHVLVNDDLQCTLEQLKTILGLAKDDAPNKGSSKLVLTHSKTGPKLYIVDASSLVGGAPNETQGLRWLPVEPSGDQVPAGYTNSINLSDVEILMTGTNKSLVLRLAKSALHGMEELVRLAKSCTDAREVRRLHARILVSQGHQLNKNSYLSSVLLDMYGKCGSPSDAKSVFDELQTPNVFSWTMLLCSYANDGQLPQATRCLHLMPQWNAVPWNSLIAAYAHCGHTQLARSVFEQMPEPTVVSWNALLSANAQNGYLDEAWSVFQAMPERNAVSWNAIVAAYAQHRRVDTAKRLFDRMEERNIISWTTLLAAYSREEKLEEARRLFERMPERNVVSFTAVLPALVSWNSVVQAYAENGHLAEAMKTFAKMPRHSVVSWNAIVHAQAQLRGLEDAEATFAAMPERNQISYNTLITSNAEAGHLDEAIRVFRQMPCHNLATIATIIGVHSLRGDVGAAEREYFRFPEWSSSLCGPMLAAYAHSGRLDEARSLFGAIRDQKPSSWHIMLAGYVAAGRISEAEQMFDQMPKLDLVSWTTMMSAYGYTKRAAHLFHSMVLDGILPDGVAFLFPLLSSGDIGDARRCFLSMIGDYGLVPIQEHYCSMVVALGRAGELSDAEELARSMPYKANRVVWLGLLGSTALHRDVLRGARVAGTVVSINDRDASAYSLLANLCAGQSAAR